MDRPRAVVACALAVYILTHVEYEPAFTSAAPGRRPALRAGAATTWQGGASSSTPGPAWVGVGLPTASVVLMLGAVGMSARRRNSQRARVVRAADLSVEGSGIMPSGPLFVYAKALGEAAAKKGEAVPVTKDILRIKKLYKDEDFLSKVEVVVNEPLKTQVEKATACVELMQPFESTVMPKFVVYLAKKRRFKTLAPLCDWYIKSLYAEQSIAPVTVISAQPLTEEQIQTVSEKMKEKTGASDVKMILKVDSSLLGGLVIEWGYPDPEKPVQGSMTIDMSLKTYLEQAALSEGVLTSV